MSSVGPLTLLPVADRVPIQAPRRVITLYPDGQRVWGHRLYRMPPSSRGEGYTYGADADLKHHEDTGQLIDVYA